MRELIAAYRKAEDLINIGAYQKGSNATIDRAVTQIDSINGFKGSINDKMDRRHEALMKDVDDLSDKISYMSGRLNGGGKH